MKSKFPPDAPATLRAAVARAETETGCTVRVESTPGGFPCHVEGGTPALRLRAAAILAEAAEKAGATTSPYTPPDAQANGGLSLAALAGLVAAAEAQPRAMGLAGMERACALVFLLAAARAIPSHLTDSIPEGSAIADHAGLPARIERLLVRQLSALSGPGRADDVQCVRDYARLCGVELPARDPSVN